jgi:hypothetical protein
MAKNFAILAPDLHITVYCRTSRPPARTQHADLKLGSFFSCYSRKAVAKFHR